MSDGMDRDLRSKCAVAVMAKASIAGKTKTRLVPPLTATQAAELNTAFLRDAADNILSAAAFAPIRGWMAFSPAGAESFFRSHLPQSIGLIETVAPTLGECLHYAASTLLRSGHDAVCLLNSDSPTLPVQYLVSAAVALAAPGDHIVLGPATDGGYYLIGLKRPHPGLFEGISWSTDQVLSQTLERARELELPVVTLPVWYDVDDAETLETLIGEVLGGQPFRRSVVCAPANWTRGHLANLVESVGLQERLLGSRSARRVS
jgi:rSAM/selenodomain-associated transferase 1